METVVEIIGVNGDTVTIAGEEAGKEGVWLLSDLEGFYDPEIDTVTKASANRPGTRFLSYRILERTVVFKVQVDNDEEGSWRERDARWRKLWKYDKYSTVRVTTDEGSRTLRVRLEEIEVDTTYDPHVNQATEIIMTVVADDPFWYATEFTKTVSVTGSATFTVDPANPTGNAVFPVWVLEGGTTWTIPDVGLGSVKLPALAAGENVVVDTDPGKRQLVSESATPVWARMNGVRFAGSVPEYTKVQSFTVSSSATTAKTAQLRLVRPFNRPWGDA